MRMASGEGKAVDLGSLEVAPGATVRLELDVFCIDSHRPSPSPENTFTVAPVSYTHLDVYKRQALHWLDRLSASERDSPRWRYWRGRTLESLGRTEEARQAYRTIADQRDYHGFLAADRLGAPYACLLYTSRCV